MNDKAWTDARIRQGFIDDGGLSEYHDPIDGARNNERIGGAIFDAWLAAHDAGVRADQAEDPEVIELARLIEEAIAQNERINAGGTSHYIEIPTALARLAASSLRNRRAVALTPTTEETELEHMKRGKFYAEVAAEHNVHFSTIQKIVTGISYKHVRG